MENNALWKKKMHKTDNKVKVAGVLSQENWLCTSEGKCRKIRKR